MKDKTIDFYLNNALIIDFLSVVVLWMINSNFSFFEFKSGSKDNNIAVLSDIIAASISLAGFILASLTIIVAIKSNLASKSTETSENPLELFFSPANYRKIVEIFQGSIVELTFCFIAAYIVWLSSENLKVYTVFKVNLILIFLLSISVVRSLLVLFKIINIKDSNNA